jgi:hypothetical protein
VSSALSNQAKNVELQSFEQQQHPPKTEKKQPACQCFRKLRLSARLCCNLKTAAGCVPLP